MPQSYVALLGRSSLQRRGQNLVKVGGGDPLPVGLFRIWLKGVGLGLGGSRFPVRLLQNLVSVTGRGGSGTPLGDGIKL